MGNLGGMKTIKANPLALAEAIRLAKGDRSRIEIQEDGSVLVRNERVRQVGRLGPTSTRRTRA